MSIPEAASYRALKSWLEIHGGGFHPDTRFNEDSYGSHIIAIDDLGKDPTVVSCPFSLVITQALAKTAVLHILGDPVDLEIVHWSERQWISTYLSLHLIVEKERKGCIHVLTHFEYLYALPAPEMLRTPLHFSPSELQLFKGTNIYGAAVDREQAWRHEWNQCRSAIGQANHLWYELFTWDKYLTMATYLSSRAFPSTLLSETPSLVGDSLTEPILIPGVDSLNHARGEPVSWFVTYPTKDTAEASQEPKISLLLHSSPVIGQELFNNYGPKPNSELILGYGFSISMNPDDTIILKVGGIAGSRWEIGRGANGVDGLWKEILAAVNQSEDTSPTYEDILDASDMLQEMVKNLLERLPEEPIPNANEIRPEVMTMFCHYVEGQKDILQSLMRFSEVMEQEAVEMARQDGIDLVLSED